MLLRPICFLCNTFHLHKVENITFSSHNIEFAPLPEVIPLHNLKAVFLEKLASNVLADIAQLALCRPVIDVIHETVSYETKDNQRMHKMAEIKDIIGLRFNIMSFSTHIPHLYPQFGKFLVK